MFGYYLDLAWRSLRRSPVLSALMVLAIGLGIGASMTMITVLHVLGGDPVPGLSSRLFVPMLDPRPVSHAKAEGATAGSPDGFVWPDVENLLRAHRADAQAAMASGFVAVRPARADLHPFFENGQYVTTQFFHMFGVPFAVGTGWTAEQDRERARVVVLGATLNRKLFGSASGVGRTVRFNNADFQVIGVLQEWQPQPAFYKQKGDGLYGDADEFFIPLQTALSLKFGVNGHTSCWGNAADDLTSDRCTWAQFWVRLDTPASVAAYRTFLGNYWREQQDHGRFPRKDTPPHLYGLMAWLAHEQVIPANLSMQMWLAIGFLLVCMLSVLALLLAKFLRRSGEISVRRALGARRRDVFAQFGVESALIGVAGGLLGLALAVLGLWSIRQRPDGYAHLARMDPTMLLGTVVLAIIASVLAGMLPAWRACNVPPALHLKTL